MKQRTQSEYFVQCGLNLKKYMQKRGFTTADFSKRLGCSPAHLSEILSGEDHLTVDELSYASIILGVPMYKILPLSRHPADNFRLAKSPEELSKLYLYYLKQMGFIVINRVGGGD